MCPGCSASQLDLSSAAFAPHPAFRQGHRGGQLPARPRSRAAGPLTVRVGPGSTSDQLAVLVLNHGNPVSAVTVDDATLALRGDGYWIGPGPGPGPFRIRITDVLGPHRAAHRHHG